MVSEAGGDGNDEAKAAVGGGGDRLDSGGCTS